MAEIKYNPYKSSKTAVLRRFFPCTAVFKSKLERVGRLRYFALLSSKITPKITKLIV